MDKQLFTMIIESEMELLDLDSEYLQYIIIYLSCDTAFKDSFDKIPMDFWLPCIQDSIFGSKVERVQVDDRKRLKFSKKSIKSEMEWIIFNYMPPEG